MSTNSIALPPPAPGVPMIVRMVTEPLKKGSDPIVFALSSPHPLANDPNIKVIRMFVVEAPDGVEVYSALADGSAGMRDRIPWSRILVVGEAMPIDVFVDELAMAEGEEEEAPETPAAATPTPAVP